MPQLCRRRCNLATAATVVSALTLVLTMFAAAPPAQARSDRLVGQHLVNHERAQAGVSTLSPDTFLRRNAQSWADEMAAGQFVAHNPRLVQIWDSQSLLGENISWGRSMEEIHGGFVSSPSHYANLVEPGYSRIGVGVAYGPGGSLYVVFLFRS